MEFTQDKVSNMVYKAKQMSVQEGIRMCGKVGKNSAMKERNIESYCNEIN